MNKIIATITKATTSQGVALIDLQIDSIAISVLLIDVIEQPQWLKVGNQVFVLFKETEVAIAKGELGLISLRNRLASTILSIQKGELMSVLALQFNNYVIHAAITTRSVESLKLIPDDTVTALIKANEITLMQYL